MTILAIDPGPEQSAYVLFDGATVIAHGIEGNDAILTRIYQGHWGGVRGKGVYTHSASFVFEQVTSYGMPVGAEVFETVFWTGRFVQLATAMLHNGRVIHRMPRREVKLHLCQSARAKDANVRQALLDRFGGLDKARGKKAAPGPLYGLKSHEWSALALAVTWWDLRRPVSPEIPLTPKSDQLRALMGKTRC